MNCRDFQELISAKLDKELTLEQERILAEHLNVCTVCVDFARKFEELKFMTSTWENAQIPRELERKILDYTLKTAPREKSIFSFLRGYYEIPRSLAWASVLLFLVLLISFSLNPLKPVMHTEKAERPKQEIAKVQKIVLTQRDVVVRSCIVSEGKNNL